ncbi:MAG TPA: aminopeptidase N [Stellaceae bacterium]|nr:aminopeptidase N [Stellaceae bacterium]
MLDSLRDGAPSSAPETAPRAIRLADYAVPDFLIDTVDLVFELGETSTAVKARLTLRRNPASAKPTAPLVLDGEALKLVSVLLDDEPVGPNAYAVDATSLTIAEVPDAFTLDIETVIEPQNNTELSGLYTSGGNFCTQCEAEGFRRITYFLDRPDVMARYTTTILADRARYPVLLSNGNPVDAGTSSAGRHWAKWVDPHPKPAYLFALVAGDLVAHRDSFVTRSGRTIPLAIWVRQGDEDRCGHAMTALKTSMRWDEEVYGFEYDLDVFNIVAVSDFNMGAMENKGLNVFNTKYILAKPETATDGDYQGIETVVAHEYFHNWTGDRVTCRDWFQLSLKEGLTVFRDQEFTADQGSRAVKRIQDVRGLRAAQFREDASPMAHPVRPDSYIEINNFYTATVYQKGAEVVRMIHTLIGAVAFRKGMDLYVERHDNQAVTIEDFVAAMQDASGVDLSQFKRWYAQAGTPELTVSEAYDPAARSFELTVSQATPPTPGQPSKLPVVIPLAIGLLDRSGAELPMRLDGEAAATIGTRVLAVTEARQTFRFVDVPSQPIPSLLRDFSAPVIVKGQSLDQLRFLFGHDTDAFARWEAGQQVGTRVLLDLVEVNARGGTLALDDGFVEGFAVTLRKAAGDPAFAAEALALPGEAFLADQMAAVNIEGIHTARRFARAELGRRLRAELEAAHHAYTDAGPYRIDGAAVGRRALKNACLALLAAALPDEMAPRALRQFETAGNMTDTIAALAVLIDLDRPERATALAAFYDAWQTDALVIDKWFALQAMSGLPGTLDAVKQLIRHPAFDFKNPNRLRALVGSFAMANQRHFHAADGAGYEFLADIVIELDGFNAQAAARILSPLGTWRRHEPGRQAKMRAALARILAKPTLSKGVFEIASKSLA